jgi:Fe-S-cluster containining protein
MEEQRANLNELCSETKLASVARHIADELLSDRATQAACETLADKLTTLGEEATNARKKAQPPPAPSACRKGCDSCCYMRVVATVPEIVSVVAFVRKTFSKQDLEALHQRIAAVRRTGSKMSDEEWGVRGLPCPFLVKGDCSIYAARPLECRGYNSMNVDACISARQHYLDWDVPMYLPEFTAYKQIQAGILQALETAGLSASIVELSAAVEAVLSSDQTIEKWMHGAPALEGVELDIHDPERRAFLPWTPSDELRGFEAQD